MRWNQTASSTSVTSEIFDLDALFDVNYLGANPVLDYAACPGRGICPGQTIPLSPDGHYNFNVTNSGTTPAWWAVSYTLYPPGSPGLSPGTTC